MLTLQRISLIVLLSINAALMPAIGASRTEDEELSAIEESKFAKDKEKCSIVSYAGPQKSTLAESQLTISSKVCFYEADFSAWNDACKNASKWISDSDRKEYESYTDLSNTFVSALKIIRNAYGKDLEKNMPKIRERLEPVVQKYKKANGSFFKKIKGVFSKETPSRNVIDTIKKTLNKRVNETINDFNALIKEFKIKGIKSLSL